ncbi:DUF3800 domain-containing protein (plasmid) [Thermus sp. PS18]|uniref:DUF3800 domain-containing protein n=1 Tax=Thermus sp. PS18 TaxID=2849039 RepID=UPI0022656EC1|nr:DUF3800 domain-containing protein [Thermus sp. PS18]UZX16816.1 DUF3800 domain-containing protein [Thermus sp. PS18]
MPVIFIDEYGTPKANNPQWNPKDFFALVAVFFQEDDYNVAEKDFLRLKRTHFYSERVVSHDQKMRKARHPFYGFRDPSRMSRFYLDFASLAQKWTYSVVLVIIDKVLTYGNVSSNPYRPALQFLLERFDMTLSLSGTIDVIIESRGEDFDSQLRCVFAPQNSRHNCRMPSAIGYALRGNYLPFFFKKDDLVAGLEIADLLLASAWRIEYNQNLSQFESKRIGRGLTPPSGSAGASALQPASVEPFDNVIYANAVYPKYLRGPGGTSYGLKLFP